MAKITSDTQIIVTCRDCGCRGRSTPSTATYGLWLAELRCGAVIESVGPRAEEMDRSEVDSYVIRECGALSAEDGICTSC